MIQIFRVIIQGCVPVAGQDITDSLYRIVYRHTECMDGAAWLAAQQSLNLQATASQAMTHTKKVSEIIIL